MSPNTEAFDATRALRRDLALALRAAHHHGLSEGICNHFSVALPDGSERFLINPQGLHWSEIGENDIVMVDSGEEDSPVATRSRPPLSLFTPPCIASRARPAYCIPTCPTQRLSP